MYKKKSFYTPEDIIERESRNEIYSRLLLTWTGCYTRARGHLVSNRQLSDYVMIYCVDGRGWLKLGDNSWGIAKGDVFVCPPDIAHSYGADENEPWTKYWVHFRGENASIYMKILGITLEAPILHMGENARILAWFNDIFEILKTGYTQANLMLATSYLNNILSYLYSLSMNRCLNKSSDIDVQAIISYMLDNICNNLNLKELSDYACLSKFHFVRMFKDKTGYSPVDYYIRLKIQKACELLEASVVSIKSISSTLGFSNPYYFSNTFKRVVGKSPQCYRKLEGSSINYTSANGK